MNGEQLDQCFGFGFSNVKKINGFNAFELNKPSILSTLDTKADVVLQQHVVDVNFNSTTGGMTIMPAQNGEGLWIPYLGNGMPGSPKGWGTYTKEVTHHTWVATGPFSGCFVAVFGNGQGKRFAHLITPAAGYTAAAVTAQINAIATATKMAFYGKWSMTGVGLGIAFFLKIRGQWRRRFAWVMPGSGTIMQVNTHSTPI